MNCNCLQVYESQNWPKSCIKRYRKNIAISSSIAIFSDVSKRCNILLSRYIAIQNAQPWSGVVDAEVCCRQGVFPRGVYSSLFQYIPIDKKLPFLAHFIKNQTNFIKNSILTRLVTNHRSARPNIKLFKTPVSWHTLDVMHFFQNSKQFHIELM